MKKLLFIIVFGIATTVSAAGSKSFTLYYNGINSGNHEYATMSLPVANRYTIKEASHTGSCQGLVVSINHVRIGSFGCSSLNEGIPIEYSSLTNPVFEASLRRGSGQATINVQISY